MNNKVNEIHSCEVCGNENLIPVLNIGLHPMCDDLVPIGDSRICKEYPIDILFCKSCLTAHQRFQVPKQDLFPKSYHYRSRFTADVLNGMSGLVDSCEESFGSLTSKKVLDIGCNDGSLLDFFRKKGANTFGIEPTNAYLDAKEKGHLTVNNYLSPMVAKDFVAENGNPDFITFTNVFAHIENLKEVIESLKILSSNQTIIIIENHYLGSVLDGNQFDTFYHEHPRTYSYTSFVHMARSLELELLNVEFPARYGGNIRIFMGKPHHKIQGKTYDKEGLIARENQFFEKLQVLSKNVEKWKKTKKAYLEDLFKKNGKLRAKAFPGRAAILVKLLDLNEDIISVVYEKPGSLKIGNYLPGTHIPIQSDDDLFALADKSLPIINFAWHIPSEIRNYLKQNGYTGEVVDILNTTDFVS